MTEPRSNALGSWPSKSPATTSSTTTRTSPSSATPTMTRWCGKIASSRSAFQTGARGFAVAALGAAPTSRWLRSLTRGQCSPRQCLSEEAGTSSSRACGGSCRSVFTTVAMTAGPRSTAELFAALRARALCWRRRGRRPVGEMSRPTCARHRRTAADRPRADVRSARRGLYGQGRFRSAEWRQAGLLKIFANPRNAAAGSLRQKDPASPRHARCGFWRTAGRLTAAAGRTQYDRCRRSRGSACRSASFSRLRRIDESWPIIARSNARAPMVPFDIDGVVYKIERLDWQSGWARWRDHRAGACSQISGRESRDDLEAIAIQVGRTATAPVGRLTPVGVGG